MLSRIGNTLHAAGRPGRRRTVVRIESGIVGRGRRRRAAIGMTGGNVTRRKRDVATRPAARKEQAQAKSRRAAAKIGKDHDLPPPKGPGNDQMATLTQMVQNAVR